MKKYKLKLFQSSGHNNTFKMCYRKSESILPIGAAIDIKDGSIVISYKEIEIKKCGFDKIGKVEIYKSGKLIYVSDNISNYCCFVPMMEEEGIYEIKSLILNSENNCRTSVINTFEFLDDRRKIVCDNFKINLSKKKGNLYISFDKKIGEIDFGEISLSNINLYDSNFNKINNIACKLHTRLNEIDFVILDVFCDNSSTLIPNEVYTLEINVKGRKILSSFLFEYDKVEMKCYKIVEEVKHEFISKISENISRVKLYFKINKCLNLYDYEYFISNIRNKFLYFKVSKDGVEDTLVFEGVLRKGNNYFELSVCKEESINIIKFIYEYKDEGIKIYEENYFSLPLIHKISGKYSITSNLKTLDKDINTHKVSLISEGVNEKGLLNENGEIKFEHISILNKFSKIYTLEVDYDHREGFVFSSSIGVNFNTIKYGVNLNENEVYIDFKERFDITGSYGYVDASEKKLEVANNISVVKLEQLNELTLIYLKVYGENNKSFFETIILDNFKINASVKIFNSEVISLNSFNVLNIVDKNIFDNLKSDFEALVFNSKGIVDRVRVNEFNNKFKIRFENSKLSNGMHYIKFKKDDFYKICSFFVKSSNKESNIFIKNINRDGFELYSLKDYKSFVRSFKVFLVMDGSIYLIFEKNILCNKTNFNLNIPDGVLVDGMEYRVELMFGNSKTKTISFSFLGESSPDVFGDFL